jgi:MoxR-like ATPase
MSDKQLEVTNLSRKFRDWEQAIKDRVVERDREARGVVIAAAARHHHLQLGPPGTAKSYMVTTGLSMVSDAVTMEILLHGYSVMEDMYGPVSLKALDEDRHLRKVDGYLPTCDFVFADEVFKANPTMLNTNLWAFNERRFRNDGRVHDIPLISGYFASNEGPEDPVLMAFDDRIGLRYLVKPIGDPVARRTMFEQRLARKARGRTAAVPVITVEEIRRAHELVAAVEVPQGVLDALNDLYDELRTVQIHPTDRKMGDALDIIQATTFFNGRTVATIGDMGMLKDVFWTNPTDIPKVAEKVAELANPIDKAAQPVADSIEDLAAMVEEIIQIETKAIRIRRATQLHDKMEAASKELMELREEAERTGIESDVVARARRRLNVLTRRLLEKGFRIQAPPSKIGKDKLMDLVKEMRDEDPD